MIYYTTGGRCAVDYLALHLSLSRDYVHTVLAQYGFQEVSIDLVTFARSYVGVSRYRRGISIQQAPHIVDCSSFVKWLYAQRGIWLPRYAIQQRAYVSQEVLRDCIQPGDLVFASRKHGLYDIDTHDRVGHVGIVSGSDLVIHASQDKGVCEAPLKVFLKGGVWRGARRVIPYPDQVYTFAIPDTQNIESSDDIRWLLVLYARSGKSISPFT
jgi:cell wall-associated NlpC family hydrolase